MSLVVDASVVLKWVINEHGSDAASALQNERLTAPALWLAEAGNALWRHVRLGEITSGEADRRFALLQNADIATIPVEQDAAAALRLATQLNHPIYDCLYLAAAIRQQTYVVTADRRFASTVAASEFREHIQLLGAN